jgi:flagellar biosynthesis/type III secretory pathway chaperone
MSLNPDACRERFAHALADETALLVALEEQLRREHELLVANDIEGLEAAGSLRQQTVARLVRVHEDRAGLCRARGHDTDGPGFAQLLAWCDPSGTLADAQALCAVHAQRCREQNERNGALVNARLNRVGGMLGMITGRSDAGTYRPGAPLGTSALAPAGGMISTSA